MLIIRALAYQFKGPIRVLKAYNRFIYFSHNATHILTKVFNHILTKVKLFDNKMQLVTNFLRKISSFTEKVPKHFFTLTNNEVRTKY